ncbi:MAG: SGNH/GDSL hydrolase family protein [Nocardioidaceae bacterium]|nr:SGNH/GDSL hydrolase family protein [Nocardioidaceae bacterium]
MTRLRLGAPIALASLIALLTGLLASPASAATVNYVALGDSYSAGVGAGSESGSCDRSPNAYPQLWANAHAPSSFSFVACTGAKTTDVTSSQISALSSSTSLVSITIGGNDIGFASTMEDCVLYSTSTCVSELNAAEAAMKSTLPGLLNTVYNNIRSHAPNAHVVVLGYPRFYDLSKSSSCVGLSTDDRTKINEAADVLDGVISTAVGAHANFAFADVRSAFANGHEICDGSAWLHSTNWLDLHTSYHPMASGQSGAYLPAFTNN